MQKETQHNLGPKTVRIYLKSGEYKIAVLPDHIQTQYEIGTWLQNNITDFHHWHLATPNDMTDPNTIRYDLQEYLTTEQKSISDIDIVNIKTDFTVPQSGRTVILDTIHSRMFWVYADACGKYILRCNYYLLDQNVLIAPHIIEDAFDDPHKAWSVMLEIKRKPHMSFMSISTPPALRFFNAKSDIDSIMALATSHITYLENQITDMKPALDAYKRTGWEPCDFHHLTSLKTENDNLRQQNSQLIEQLTATMKKIETSNTQDTM